MRNCGLTRSPVGEAVVSRSRRRASLHQHASSPFVALQRNIACKAHADESRQRSKLALDLAIHGIQLLGSVAGAFQIELRGIPIRRVDTRSLIFKVGRSGCEKRAGKEHDRERELEDEQKALRD